MVCKSVWSRAREKWTCDMQECGEKWTCGMQEHVGVDKGKVDG